MASKPASPYGIAAHHRDRHLEEVKNILQEHVDKKSGTLDIEMVLGEQVKNFTFYGYGDTHGGVLRGLGGKSHAMPLKKIRNDIWAWVGYHEKWGCEGTGPEEDQKWSFLSASITIYFGEAGATNKPQVFRLEWDGTADLDTGGKKRNRAPKPGQPHWQFDILNSVIDTKILSGAEEQQRDAAAAALGDLKGDEENCTHDSDSDNSISATSKPITDNEFSRIHLPSAAIWWKDKAECIHIYRPSDLKEIRRWLCNSLVYLSSELGRLAKHSKS